MVTPLEGKPIDPTLSPSEQETVTTLGPLVLATLKALNLTNGTITHKQVEEVSTNFVKAYKAGQTAGLDEGDTDSQQNTKAQ